MSEPSKNVSELQEEILVLRKQLVEAQQKTALGELVSTTTHEFNNVLMTILNYAKMGIRYEDKETRDKAFNKIHKAGLRAAKITNAVLGMARNRTDQFVPTNLAKLIEETMVLLEREMQKYRIGIDFDLQEVPDVSANGNQIQQILMNLLINARQAMADGGQMVIKLGHDSQSNTTNLTVRDYGPGMAQETMRKIFEPYFSTKSGPDETGKGGTGVGLWTCKNIMEAHGGKIRVESSLGKGTCFTLMFPAATRSIPVPNSPSVKGAGASMSET